MGEIKRKILEGESQYAYKKRMAVDRQQRQQQEPEAEPEDPNNNDSVLQVAITMRAEAHLKCKENKYSEELLANLDTMNKIAPNYTVPKTKKEQLVDLVILSMVKAEQNNNVN